VVGGDLRADANPSLKGEASRWIHRGGEMIWDWNFDQRRITGKGGIEAAKVRRNITGRQLGQREGRIDSHSAVHRAPSALRGSEQESRGFGGEVGNGFPRQGKKGSTQREFRSGGKHGEGGGNEKRVQRGVRHIPIIGKRGEIKSKSFIAFGKLAFRGSPRGSDMIRWTCLKK